MSETPPASPDNPSFSAQPRRREAEAAEAVEAVEHWEVLEVKEHLQALCSGLTMRTIRMDKKKRENSSFRPSTAGSVAPSPLSSRLRKSAKHTSPPKDLGCFAWNVFELNS